MHDYELFAYDTKDEFLDKSRRFWNADKTQFWQDTGVDLVIDRREGYFLWDMEGRRLLDVHLNGGTYNLGHRNPEIVGAVRSAMDHFDMGNHHFPSLARTALAEKLVDTAPQGLTRVAYASGGGEAVTVFIECRLSATAIAVRAWIG